MSNMAASRGLQLLTFFQGCRRCTTALFLFNSKSVFFRSPYAKMTIRRICMNMPLHGKNLAAVGPEKYTEEFIKKQIEQFNLGKRHLANMMGEDPETMTQEDIDRAIAYLFPSGLFEKKARPLMKHPDEIFPKQRAVQCGEDGRPFHFLFYTGKQSYYSLMHDTYGKMFQIQKYEDHFRAKDLFSKDEKQINLVGTRWLTKEELEELLVESISTHDYRRFIQLMERILCLQYCSTEEEYILKFRQKLEAQSKKHIIQPLQYDEDGIAFIEGEGRRKAANAKIILHCNGSGRITVNGLNYLNFFPVLQDREQLMFPFQFLNRIGQYDMDCTVSGSGRSAQAGAIRLAASRALLSLVTETEAESLRQAGLLTADPRIKERKKPGQEGARRKFTWKKR
ncbi:28S ribosomal protein S9, mitochondrial [Erpetoichthys calabaricus]|uniref:Small ribosomal subunit protein uS9m n=1 Tax=Erpetoichthys calabaricus TaxID=27687 RepID=A0A8C4X3G9_ERPCA|nr:28S ribosomal protein S9, mitochondrial [Erpetoichthys calabaricus]